MSRLNPTGMIRRAVENAQENRPSITITVFFVVILRPIDICEIAEWQKQILWRNTEMWGSRNDVLPT